MNFIHFAEMLSHIMATKVQPNPNLPYYGAAIILGTAIFMVFYLLKAHPGHRHHR
jgi:hypothetical protein